MSLSLKIKQFQFWDFVIVKVEESKIGNTFEIVHSNILLVFLEQHSLAAKTIQDIKKKNQTALYDTVGIIRVHS